MADSHVTSEMGYQGIDVVDEGCKSWVSYQPHTPPILIIQLVGEEKDDIPEYMNERKKERYINVWERECVCACVLYTI